MGAKSQRKGRTAELELARILQSHGYDVRPGMPLSFGREPDIVGLNGVHCELKRREGVDLSVALAQVSKDAEFFRDGLPAVFHRGNRQGWLCTMRLEDWMGLYLAVERQKTAESGKEA